MRKIPNTTRAINLTSSTHRQVVRLSGEETANVDRVLDGDIDAFIYAYLKSRAAV